MTTRRTRRTRRRREPLSFFRVGKGLTCTIPRATSYSRCLPLLLHSEKCLLTFPFPENANRRLRSFHIGHTYLRRPPFLRNLRVPFVGIFRIGETSFVVKDFSHPTLIYHLFGGGLVSVFAVSFLRRTCQCTKPVRTRQRKDRAGLTIVQRTCIMTCHHKRFTAFLHKTVKEELLNDEI
ncbi:hypothetical protein DFH11DRAFT_1629948 [Phellopilus nigrolimitatus]|nr:hypothetical protein DFH11DRAFT_1629948 [Phellopilus nigrolimitatus]